MDLFVVSIWKLTMATLPFFFASFRVLFNFRFCFLFTGEQKQGDIRGEILPSSGRSEDWEDLSRSHVRKDDGS